MSRDAVVQHGTMGAYANGCRCLPCRVRNAQRVARQRKGAAIGRVLVDATPAREHLWALKAKGIGVWRAATLAKLSKPLLSKVRAGTITKVQPATLAAILAIPATPSLNRLVSAAETWRRLRTLIAEGYSRRELARRLGYVSKLPFLKGEGAKITERSAMKVRRLFRELEHAKLEIVETIEVDTPVVVMPPRKRTVMKHEGCGGALEKDLIEPGRYTCSTCGGQVEIGHAPQTDGYIRKQGFVRGDGRR